jgi:hypothetical protein
VPLPSTTCLLPLLQPVKSSLHYKTRVRAHDLIQGEVMIAETIFQLFLRHIREKPVSRVGEYAVIDRDILKSPTRNDSLLNAKSSP